MKTLTPNTNVNGNENCLKDHFQMVKFNYVKEFEISESN